MKSAGEPGCGETELPFLYALQAVRASEVPAAEAHLAACAHCRRDLQTLRPVIDAFVAWPADVLRPVAPLWDRLVQRIGGDRPASPKPPASPAEWKDVAPGISCRLLATDTERGRVSMLVRLARGAAYPPHRHAGREELYMLDGELIVDGDTFHPGDYRRANAARADQRVWSETGCTCVLLTSIDDVLV